MRVLIYIQDAHQAPHFERELEIAAKHLSQGDDVHVIQCKAEMPACFFNPYHKKHICVYCKLRCKKGLDLIGLAEQNRHTLHLGHYLKGISLPTFSDINELKAFEIDGIDHGMAAASSVISTLRDTRPDLRQHEDLVKRNLLTSVALYEAMTDALREIKPAILYCCNGRGAYARSAARAAQREGVRGVAHELTPMLDRYMQVEGVYVHDLEAVGEDINTFWRSKASFSEKEDIAKQYFEKTSAKKLNGNATINFWDEMKPGRLPDGFDKTKCNVAIFNSSGDEYEGIEDYQNPIYKDEAEALNRIIHSPDVNRDVHFYLRVHPNLSNLDNFQTRAIRILDSDRLTVIPAESNIDTYALMEACDKVLTFGSTIGIESVYWEKPSILVGRALYEDLDACYIPYTHVEVIYLINSPLSPKAKTGALKYAFFWLKGTEEYRYFKPESHLEGRFMGRYLALLPFLSSRTEKRIVDLPHYAKLMLGSPGIFFSKVYKTLRSAEPLRTQEKA